MLAAVFLCAIHLVGVTGRDLRARAFFDANNVKVGDPLVLTIDFLGDAEFKDLHPPALSKAVDRKDWKLDDASAKTDTFRDARRLTYRVRPMREGLLWFPALSFTYESESGEKRTVGANAIPVHARGGAQVVVDGMEDDVAEADAMPKPPELVEDMAYGTSRSAVSFSEDEAFAWRKALSDPSVAAFAAFDCPAARLNEAICAVKDGNWLHAVRICRRLEWRIGQTPEIEKLMVAAIALRRASPSVELPVWRQVMRPLLRLAWAGRIAAVLGAALSVTLLLWLLGRLMRSLACIALVFAAASVFGETVETVTTNADGTVVHKKVIRGGNGFSSVTISSSSGPSAGQMPSGLFGRDPFDMFEDFDPFGRRAAGRPAKVDVAVSLEADKPSVSVGEDFNLVLSVEMPRAYALADDIRLSVRESALLQQTARPATMAAQRTSNPTNAVSRIVFPMRAISPVEGPLHFSVEGSYVPRGRGFSFFRSSYPFATGPRTAPFTVKPLPEEGRPADFGGIVASRLDVFEFPDLLKVGTNDVVTIAYRVRAQGYVPPAWQPRDVAFEWARGTAADGRGVEVEYRRYFVADGSAKTPVLSVSYWDPAAKAYKTVSAGGTKLTYVADR